MTRKTGIVKYWSQITTFVTWLILSALNLKIYWMLIDDGYDVWFAKTFLQRLAGLDFVQAFQMLLEGGGRFRPIYWIYHSFVYLVGGTNFIVHRLFHVLIFGLIILFIYKIIKKITGSDVLSLASSILFAVIPMNIENWARLGPQEPLLSLFLLLGIYFLFFGKDLITASVFFAMAIFTKENSIAILAGIFFIVLFSKRLFGNQFYRKTKSLFIFLSILASILLLIILNIRSGYSTNYSFFNQAYFSNLTSNFQILLQNTRPFIQIACLTFILRIISRLRKGQEIIKDKNDYYEFFFLICSLSFILVQSPWKYVLDRYLFPAFTFLILFIFLEFKQVASLLNNKKFGIFGNNLKRITYFVFIAYLIYDLFSLFINNVSRIIRYWPYDSLKDISYYISQNTPKDSVIYLNMERRENTVELLDEMNLHLTEFFSRPDIKFKYLQDFDGCYKCYFLSSDSLPTLYSEEELRNRYNLNVIYKSGNPKTLPVFTTSTGLIKQLIKKTFLFVVKRQRLNLDGIYTQYILKNDWYLYE